MATKVQTVKARSTFIIVAAKWLDKRFTWFLTTLVVSGSQLALTTASQHQLMGRDGPHMSCAYPWPPPSIHTPAPPFMLTTSGDAHQMCVLAGGEG